MRAQATPDLAGDEIRVARAGACLERLADTNLVLVANGGVNVGVPQGQGQSRCLARDSVVVLPGTESSHWELDAWCDFQGRDRGKRRGGKQRCREHHSN